MSAKKQFGFEPDYAIPPGETLKEVMDSFDMTQAELASRTQLTVQSINRIFKGDQPISYETANKLELATGVPATMWNNLEAQYREQLAKISERERLAKNLDWLKNIPTKELIERGAIKPVNDRISLLREVLAFYGVSSVDAWNEIWEAPKVAARRSECFETRPGPASAWIRLGEIQAHQIECKPFNKRLFAKTVSEIKEITTEDCSEFVPKMKKFCSASGIALALVKEIKKVPWHGATKWLSSDKAMILLNLRGKGEDQFWFSFFHEAGHILHDSKDSKKDLLINDGKENDPREARANRYAEDVLIPKDKRDRLEYLRTPSEVKAYAKELGISPGIVVGQFHHVTHKWTLFHNLIKKFAWVED